jgi:hypothetical protein
MFIFQSSTTILNVRIRTRGSSVDIAAGFLASIPDRSRVHADFEALQAFYEMGIRGSFPRLNRPGRDADRPPPYTIVAWCMIICEQGNLRLKIQGPY